MLLWIDRRFNPAPGRLMAMYVVGYGIGRFWVEGLRIDNADHVAGLRWNQWVALAAIVGGLVLPACSRGEPSARRRVEQVQTTPEPEPDSPDLPASSS